MLWHNASTGESQIWLLSGSSRIGRATVMNGARPTLIGLPWSLVGSSDFNGDGSPDLLWHHGSTGETQIWHLNANAFLSRAVVLGEGGGAAHVGSPWAIVGANDMNSDGKADIIWHNASSGETQFWYLNGYAVTGRGTVVVARTDSLATFVAPWSLVSSRDFNGDGQTDLVWHNGATGETQLWYLNGRGVIGRTRVLGETGRTAMVGAPWRITGSNDFDGDGSADLLWHNEATGESQIWFMNGRSVVRRATVEARDGGGAMVGPPWSVVRH
jgi:hypothetical protein